MRWLLPRVTTAGRFSSDTAAHLAFTAAGLRRLGLPDSGGRRVLTRVRSSGMATPNRSRFLGDTGDSAPDSWAWGGPGGPEIDGLVLLYASSADLLNERQAELMRRLAEVGAREVTVLDTLERLDREPFGFRDGISQPVVEGLPKATGASDRWPAGEFVLGYPNGYGQLTDRPLLPQVRRSRAAAAGRSGRIRRGRPGAQRHLPGTSPARTGR